MSISLPPVPLPGIEPLLSGTLWNDWRTQRPELFELRDVAAQVRTLEAGLDQWMFQVRPPVQPDREAVCVILHRDAATAAQFFDTATTRLGGVEGLLHDPAAAAVGLVFPHDPTILSLSMLADPEAPRLLRENVLGRRFRNDSKLSILRWHPGRRALVRVLAEDDDQRQICLEAFPLDRIDSVLHSQEQVFRLAESGAPFRTPQSYSSTDYRNLLIREWFTDPTWEDQARKGDLDAESAEMAGRALAYLHGSTLEVDHHASPPEVAEELLSLGEVLRELLPSHAGRLQELSERVAEGLCQLNLSPSSVVLGRLNARNILTSQRRPIWLGARATARGSAALDLGDLALDLERLGAPAVFRQFLSGYEAESVETPPPVWTDAVRAVHQFRALVQPLSELVADWPERMVARLEALEALTGKARA